MDTRLSVVFTSGMEKNLSKRQWRFVSSLNQRLESEGLRIVIGLETDRLEERYQQVCSSQGILVVAFPQWEAARTIRDQQKKVLFSSEFVHIANAMAVAAKKPLLVLREKTVAERGSLRQGYVYPMLAMPTNVDADWLESLTFQDVFRGWLTNVKAHKHVFLGYSSQATDTAMKVKAFLADQLNLKVLDWKDYRPGGVIMHDIEESELHASCGVFLFMADDRIESEQERLGAPRDNVVYEAGFFAGAKGHGKTLIIREPHAKVPTDLSGVKYLELTNRNDTSSIETKMREYFEMILSNRS